MQNNRYALITGGAGFIGSHMSQKLVNNNYKLIIIDNLFRGSLENIKDILKDENNKFYNIDLVTHKSISKLKDIFIKYKPDLIIHYAAINGTQYFYDEPTKVSTVNSISTYNVLEALKIAKKIVKVNPKFCFASTSETYGEPFNIPTSENDVTYARIDQDRDSYSAAKLMSEFYTRLYCKELKIDFLILRIFNVYGPKMIGTKYGQVIPEFISRILQGEYPLKILGKGNHTRSFCYIDDHINLTFNLINSKCSNQIINLGNPEEISILDLATKVMDQMNLKPKFEFTKEREGDHLRRCPNIMKLLDYTGGYNFLSLEDGLKRTIKYYKDKKNS
jgi:nucleoside-diphosphate-sugar epimerase